MSTDRMKRIAVLGVSGSGKTTLARTLHERLQLPLTHLDTVFWKPGWVKSSKSEFLERHEALITQDAWIIEGVYSSSFPSRMARADTVIYLDVPRLACVWRVYKRVLTTKGRDRSDLPPGCPERLPDWELLHYIWTWHARKHPSILEHLHTAREAGKRVLHFQSTQETQAWLATLAGRVNGSGSSR